MDLKIDVSEWLKKQNRLSKKGFAKFPAKYLDYSGNGACGVHTEKINFFCTEIHLVSHPN